MDSDKWYVGLTDGARAGLSKLPKDEAKKAQDAMEQMELHPYVSATKLKYTKGNVIWRRKKGRLRVIFQVNKVKHEVRILALDLRGDETYDKLDADPGFAD
jgi:mRNA-degrading endonuclease RelE of RelBE toxin-antitoxin system